MTPDERALIADLFNRLAELEKSPRDGEAERAIREGLSRAPNAVYALVQTVLVQDEALKMADARIAELQDEVDRNQSSARNSGSFLDTMRDSFAGGGERRGSVPQVRRGDDAGYAPRDREPGRDAWGRQEAGADDGGYGGGRQMPGQTGPFGGHNRQMAGQPGTSGGGSFLGTAAAAAAGAIGGGLLMNSIRGMLGGQTASAGGAGGEAGKGGPFATAFEQLSGKKPEGGSSGSGELAREAGLEDIGQSRRAGIADTQKERDNDQYAQNDADDSDQYEDDDDFDDGYDEDSDIV